MPDKDATYAWTFQRMGGLDQVTLRTTDELVHFDDLDPKLWVALSCPVEGLRFDHRTLELLDSDHDGRIRVREIRAAVDWTTARLVDPSVLAERREDLPLSRIRSDTEEGRRLLASAHRILRRRGKADSDSLAQEDVAAAVQDAAQAPFNGDGVMVVHPELDPDLRQFIDDIIKTLGGVKDASGEQGVDLDSAQRFMDEAASLRNWKKELDAATASFPLGQRTEEAFTLYRAVAAKLDDYFIRCRLAAYEPGSIEALNAPEALLARLGEQQLSTDQKDLAELPLAHVAADRPLPLGAPPEYSGLNPAWRNAVRNLRRYVVLPLLGERQTLSEEDWTTLKARFAPYAAIVDRKPQTPVESLGRERIAAILDSDVAARFAALVRKDLDGKEVIAAIADVERLVLYHKHLYRLLMNFVSFHDFYALSPSTTFQIGTLYLDGKSCHLCLAAGDVERHAALAKLSQLCLVYCECVRKDEATPLKIVAAVTAGSSSLIVPGRHGVFVDNDKEEWDATVLKLVDNPISIRAAVFAPYQRLGRMISDQIAKLTAEKNDKLLADATDSLKKLANPATAKSAPFDIGRSVGIFAAIGLALGAIGTALAGIAAALLALHWWQLPLLLLGIFIVVSGPSVFLAWLKLRKRTLGPVLDASGWAVNSQIPVNLTMGHVLTGAADLPPNASTLRDDPLHPPQVWKKRLVIGIGLCLAALLAAGVYWGWTGYGRPALERLAESAEAPAETPPAAGQAVQTPAAPDKGGARAAP